MRKIIYCFIAALLIVSTAYAQTIGNMNLGYLKVGTKEVATLGWQPDFKFGPWGLGADVNIAIGEDKPSGYENVVLRYLEYDDSKKGLRYGVIDSLTWGHGLLLDAYSTRLTGQVLLNNEQMAWLGYYDMDPYVIRALTTRTGVNGIRAEEKINPMLTLGETYITETNQKVSGLGLDATVPLPWNFEGYGEYAMLVDHGSGYGAGISWGQDFMVTAVDLTAGYRFLDSKFVPGYFNAEYETNPVNLTSVEANTNSKNGYLIKLGLKALGLATLNARYENYNESDAAVYADLFAKLPQDVEVTGYYSQPKFDNFRSLTLEQGAIMGGSLAYPVNPFTKIIVHYKKAYNSTTSQVEETQYYEMKLSF